MESSQQHGVLKIAKTNKDPAENADAVRKSAARIGRGSDGKLIPLVEHQLRYTLIDVDPSTENDRIALCVFR